MVTLLHVFLVVGAILIGAAVQNALDRRWLMAAFWLIASAPFLLGDLISDALKRGVHWPAQALGGGVIALAVLAALGKSRSANDEHQAAAREASAARLRNRLFIPALAIPVLTFALYFASRYLPGLDQLFDAKQASLIALGAASLLSLIIAIGITGARPVQAFTESRRLIDTIGWALLLPMLLATLGVVFVETGVGTAVSHLVGAVIPIDNRYACLIAYGIGMIAFTFVTGNAFTAFPVMLSGIGLPLLIQRHGADAASLGALGMVTGYCGTLLTPMAANFNIVPVLLLDLPSEYSVIRAQRPTAFVLIVVNLVLMAVLVFR